VDSDPGADTQKHPHNIKPELSHLASKTSLVSWAGSTVYGLPPRVRISRNLPVPPDDRVSSVPQLCPLQAKHRGRYLEARRSIPENSFGFDSLPPRTGPVPPAFRFHPCTLAGHKSKPEPPTRNRRLTQMSIVQGRSINRETIYRGTGSGGWGCQGSVVT